MATDILAGAEWQCGAVAPGAVQCPEALDRFGIEWLSAAVPGTAAAAMRDAGLWSWGADDEHLLDGRDWWFRCAFDAPSPGQRWELDCGGLATIADVWLNGTHLLHSENMFRGQRVAVERLEARNELAMRFAALTPVLAQRRPRPRWKSRLVRSQNLRWQRTTLIGRAPGWSRWAAPVGPWRPIRLTPIETGKTLLGRRLSARCVGDGGEVSLVAELRCDATPSEVLLRVAGEQAKLDVVAADTARAADTADAAKHVTATGTIGLAKVERWWPHTHGAQDRYPVTLVVDGEELELGSVGFRTLALDRADGAFALLVNDTPIFCRGACWISPEALSPASAPDQVRAAIRAARDAGMNMLRVPAYTWYEDATFWDACDELGLLVWQDCMLAAVDPPEDPEFLAELSLELADALSHAEGRPSLALICGSSETYQQPAMLGFSPDRWYSRLLEVSIPEIVSELVPGVPYVASSPSGGDLPFAVDAGVAHYFGVGAYLRPLEDARSAGVRFAAECLAFATPPEPETVLEAFATPAVVGHDPRWKSTVARDAGTSWDFEDVRDHYVRELFGVDPLEVRYSDPERALDFGRAAVAEAMTAVLSGWRRHGSGCAGALVLAMRDLWPGAGWGLVDSLGRPKAPWYAFARVFAPRTVLITDEGLSGPRVHLFNDRGQPFAGRLSVTIFDVAGTTLERVDRGVELDRHASLELGAWELFGGFRDFNAAYRFGPSAYDAMLAELEDDSGAPVATAVHSLIGAKRSRLPDVGLEASIEPAGDGWSLQVSSRLFAQYVAFDVPGFSTSDAWFHMPPGGTRIVTLAPREPVARPSGSLRALNAVATERIAFREKGR